MNPEGAPCSTGGPQGPQSQGDPQRAIPSERMEHETEITGETVKWGCCTDCEDKSLKMIKKSVLREGNKE